VKVGAFEISVLVDGERSFATVVGWSSLAKEGEAAVE
jgi:hypothetical protein